MVFGVGSYPMGWLPFYIIFDWRTYAICLAHISAYNAHIRAIMGLGIDLYSRRLEMRYMRVKMRNKAMY